VQCVQLSVAAYCQRTAASCHVAVAPNHCAIKSLDTEPATSDISRFHLSHKRCLSFVPVLRQLYLFHTFLQYSSDAYINNTQLTKTLYLTFIDSKFGNGGVDLLSLIHALRAHKKTINIL